MNRSIPLTGATVGGLLTAAFLQAATAAADSGDSGSDASGFTIGDLSFTDPTALAFVGHEPTGEAYESFKALFSIPPLLAIATDNPLGITQGYQQFTVDDSSGTTLGTVDTSANMQNLLGIDTTQFTVTSTDPAAGLTDGQAAELPTDGSVYSITNLGGGFTNVYEAVANSDGTAASSITDTLVTPFGNINVPTSYDAVAPLSPANALEALGDTSDASGLSDNAFTIGDTTFDPGSDGFNPGGLSVFSAAPLLSFEVSKLALIGQPKPTQDLEVYTNGTDDGTVHTSVNNSDLLGIDSTQFTVQGVTPTGDDSDLPAVGTVYSVTNIGGGFENIYQAVPGTGSTATTMTDTLVTPFGNINVPTTYDATVPLDPATPLGALAATSDGTDLSDNAFTIGGMTFDPGSDGFTASAPLFGIAPLLEIAKPFFGQSGIEMYDSSGTDLGTVSFNENLSNILGLINTTQFGVAAVDPAEGLSAAQTAELPAVTTTYSITELGNWTNVYEAIPGANGGAATITDTLITPFGDIDLSKLFGGFDAIAPLDAGVVDGVSTASSGFDLFDPSTWF